MMTVIEQGKKPQPKLYKHKCKVCECVFKCDVTEAHTKGWTDYEPMMQVYCPSCHSNCRIMLNED